MKNDKLRDMVRSILPSTRRKRAREEKARMNRWARRVARHELRTAADYETADLDREADHYGTVAERRRKDKLNHFMRWGEAITRGMPDTAALKHIRAILPKNLIGDHAYVHWKAHVERRHRFRRIELRQSWIDRWRFKLRRALSEDPMLHGELNAEIKARRMFDEDRRLLFGFHDIDAFIEDLVPVGRCSHRYVTERRVMLRRVREQERGRPVRSARASRPGTVQPASETLAGCGRDVRAPFSDLLRPLAAAA